MTDKERPAVGTTVRLLDPEYFGSPRGTVLDVVEDGEFNGFFGKEEITVVGEDGSEWYAALEDEGTAWERVEEGA